MRRLDRSGTFKRQAQCELCCKDISRLLTLRAAGRLYTSCVGLAEAEAGVGGKVQVRKLTADVQRPLVLAVADQCHWQADVGGREAVQKGGDLQTTPGPGPHHRKACCVRMPPDSRAPSPRPHRCTSR